MKKILTCLLFVLTLVSMLLSSCALLPTAQQNNQQPGTQPKELSATEVLDSINERMDNVSSYEADSELEMSVYVDSKNMAIDGRSEIVVFQEDDSYFYNSTTMTITYNGVESDAESIEGFDGGNYFISVSSGGKKRAFYSELSSSEFDSFYELISEDNSALDGYKQISHVKTADGRYIVTLEKYDKRTVDVVNNSLGLPAEDGGGRISDIKVSIEADADFYIEYVTVEYIFTNDSFSGKRVTAYTNYGNAQKVLGKLDTFDYKKVSDARAIRLYAKLLTDRQMAENGDFTFFTVQELSLSGQQSLNRETDTVNYGFDDNGYYFDVDADVNGQEINVSYKDGTYQINGKVQNNEDYTEDTAKTFINGLIDPFDFSPQDATTITTHQLDSRTIQYSIKIDSINSSLADKMKATYRNAGGVCSTAELVLSFTVKNNEIIYIGYKIQTSGSIKQSGVSYGMSLNIETSTDFSD